MVDALISGLVLGLSAGLAPGPLLTLVLAQSLRHGSREGCKVALTPFLTDAPVILAAFWLAARAEDHQLVLGAISLIGGLFVLYLAIDALRAPAASSVSAPTKPRSWLKGFGANILSPHPWLFWMTVGAATMARVRASGWFAVVLFLVVFYALLVGAKLVLALAVGRSRDWLQGRGYRWTMRLLSGVLALFALFLLQDAVARLR